MKITLDTTGGDLISIERLLHLLGQPNKIPERLPELRASTNQWIAYLTNLINQVMYETYNCKKPTRSFTFHFEDEYLTYLEEAKRRINE